jgi:isochorismate hydrolase
LKELYFTPDTIESSARDMLREVEAIRRHKPISFNPECASLLILDMQEYFLAPDSHAFVPSAAAILPRIQALIQGFKSQKLPVTFTRHINSPENAGMMAAWWQDLITEDHPFSQIIPELVPMADRVITKTQYDGFYGTSLEEILTSEGVRQVLISGVMTHLCCAMTACSAFMRGFEVFFLVDGTATYSEQFHRATLLNLSHGFAVPVLTTEILRALER